MSCSLHHLYKTRSPKRTGIHADLSGLLTIVCFGIFTAAGYGTELSPGVTLAGVISLLLLLGALFNRYILFHGISFLRIDAQTVEK